MVKNAHGKELVCFVSTWEWFSNFLINKYQGEFHCRFIHLKAKTGISLVEEWEPRPQALSIPLACRLHRTLWKPAAQITIATGRLDAEKPISRCLQQSQWQPKVPPKAVGIEGCNLSQTWLVSRSTLSLGVTLVDKQGRIKNKNYFDFEAGWLRRDQNNGGTYSLTKTKTKTEEQLTSRVQFWTL